MIRCTARAWDPRRKGRLLAGSIWLVNRFSSDRGWIAAPLVVVDRGGASRQYHIADPTCGFLWVLMLPDSKAYPASLFKVPIGIDVPRPVASDLISPEIGVRHRGRVMLRATMPEAAIEEDSDPGLRKHKVSGSPEAFDGTRRHLIAKAQCVDCRAKGHFGPGVPALVGLHTCPGARRGGPRLSHRLKVSHGVPIGTCRCPQIACRP